MARNLLETYLLNQTFDMTMDVVRSLLHFALRQFKL